MKERLERLECMVESLSARVEELARELSARRAPAPPHPEPAGSSPSAPPARAAEARHDEDRAISRGLEDLVARHELVLLTGLASLVLAGAMVLRVVTIGSPVPLAVGATLGLAYCGGLLLVAERKLHRGSSLHGDVFAILAALILGTLLVEVTRRGGFARPVSYLVLGVFLAIHSTQAIRRNRLAPFAVGLLATPVAGVAIGGTPFLHPHFAAVLAVTVIASHAGARVRGWNRLRWGPALMCLLYLAVLGVIASAAARRDLPQHAFARPLPTLAIAAGIFALLVLPGTVAGLVRARRLDAFEIFTAIAGAVLTYAVSALILVASPTGALVCGVTGAVLAAFFYAAAFKSFERHGAESGSFYALSAIGLIYAVASLPFLFEGGGRVGTAYQALGLTTAFLAARLGKRSLSFQAHLLTFGAAGVLAVTTFSLSPPPEESTGRLVAAAWLLLSGSMAAAVFARLRSFRLPGDAFRIDRLTFAASMRLLVLVVGAAELVAGATPFVHLAAIRAFGAPSGGPESGAFWHTSETLLLMVAAVGALALGVRWRTGAVTILAVLLMSLAGVRLAVHDAISLPAGHVIFSSAAFGLALILSSFLYRRNRGLRGGATALPGPDVKETLNEGA